jgi:hypothetical protein
MALRPFVTAGVAFAAAGAVAATVAIAPPMSPGEVQVAQNTDAKLSADARDLINTFFGEFPGDPDNSGTTGVAGVVQQILQNTNVNDPAALQVIDGLFEDGLSEVVRIFLTRYGADPITNTQIDLFFNEGLSELIRYRLLAFNGDPQQRYFINTLFGQSINDDGGANISQNGFSGLAYNFIVGTGLSVEQRRIIDTFFNAATPYNSQAVPVMVPNEATPDPDDVIQDVDEQGNPIFVGNSNPARRGAFGVIYNTIVGTGLSVDQRETLDQLYDGGVSLIVKERLLDSTTDPTQERDINALFDGGISENFRWRLIAGANGDQRSIDLTNEFFDNGISGVIRYLLVGPVPEEEGAPVSPPPAPPATTATTLVADVEETSTLEETSEVQAPAPTARKAAAPAATEAAAPAADPVSAPAPAPAAAPAPAESTSSVKKEAAAEEAEGTGVKDGNKVEPEIIIPGGGGGKNGSGSWGIFGDVAQAVVKHITGGTKAPAAGGGTTGGTTDGAADGADNDGGDGE